MNFFGVLVKTADASIGHVDVEAPEAPMDGSGPPPGDPEVAKPVITHDLLAMKRCDQAGKLS